MSRISHNGQTFVNKKLPPLLLAMQHQLLIYRQLLLALASLQTSHEQRVDQKTNTRLHATSNSSERESNEAYRPDIVSLLHLSRVPPLPEEEQLVEKQHTPEEVAVVFPYGAQGAAHTQRVDAAEGNSYLRRNNCSSFPI